MSCRTRPIRALQSDHVEKWAHWPPPPINALKLLRKMFAIGVWSRYVFVVAKRKLRWCGACAAAWLWAMLWTATAPAFPSFHQECAELSREDGAQIEARVLASLSTRTTGELDISIVCERGIADVSASGGALEGRRRVSLTGPVNRDKIVALAELVVNQLLAFQPAQPSTAFSVDNQQAGYESRPCGGSAPDAVAGRTEASHSCVAGPAPVVATSRLDARLPVASPTSIHHEDGLRSDASVETWGSEMAAGVRVGLAHRTRAISFAFLAGGSALLSSQPLFRATEWLAVSELAWQPSGLLGLRFATGLGLSLLNVTPTEKATALSGTSKSAGFFELSLVRPFELGRLSLAPILGLRAFSAHRTVRVDAQRELRLVTPMLRAGLIVTLSIGD